MMQILDVSTIATVCQSFEQAKAIAAQLDAVLMSPPCAVEAGVTWEHLVGQMEADEDERHAIVVLVNKTLVPKETFAQIRRHVLPILEQGEVLNPPPEEMIDQAIRQAAQAALPEAEVEILYSDQPGAVISDELKTFLSDSLKILASEYESLSDEGLLMLQDVLSEPAPEHETERREDLARVEAEIRRRSER